ncbi:MAG: hypothetical protein GY862_24090 [Gammaproteobacteria bacterium]|nr:hypothetical protein [Gammaproteobacteria bacterium]
MKRYQELLINLLDDEFDNFIENIVTSLSEQWFRDKEEESNIPSFSDQKMYCFQRHLEDGLDSSLWLTEKDKNTLYVSNIVPTEKPELSIVEYNSILNDFFNSFLQDASRKYNANIDMTSEDYSLDDLINKEAAKALRVFSSFANKSTGSAHPKDRERWLDFILLAYSDRKNFSPDEVEKFLLEDGWTHNFAVDLAIEYEFGIDLLEHTEEVDVL